MYDMVEVRNLDGEKINIHLEENTTPCEDLGEYYAQVRIGNESYMLVGKQTDDAKNGDIEGREWSLIHSSSIKFSNEFFEQENIELLIQMITPYLGEERLKKVIAILKEKIGENNDK